MDWKARDKIQGWSDAEDYIVENCEDIEESVGNNLSLANSYLCRCYRKTPKGTVLRTHLNFTKNWQGSKTRIGKKLSKIKEQILINQHTGTLDDFITLSMRGDNELLEIKESITIKLPKPTLNDNKTSKELFLFNWLIIVHSYSNDDNIILTKIICVIYLWAENVYSDIRIYLIIV